MPTPSSWRVFAKDEPDERRGAAFGPSLPASSSVGLEELEAWLTWLWSDALLHWRPWLGLLVIADGVESAEPRLRADWGGRSKYSVLGLCCKGGVGSSAEPCRVELEYLDSDVVDTGL
jgi:hypothetical protein